MSQVFLKAGELSQIRGRFTENAPLGEGGWFKCGGRAEILFKPADLEDLQVFLHSCNPSPSIPLPKGEREADEGKSPSPFRERGWGEGLLPVHIFGALSNTIIRDGGLPGVTIRLGREFSRIEIIGDTVKAGALALDSNVAQVAAEAGIGGLEFLSGIPGTIGGALRMNAGCYGVETKDVLISCEVLDRQGNLRTFYPCHPGASRDRVGQIQPGPGLRRDDRMEDVMHMTYRHNDLPEEYIFISATFQGKKDSPANVLDRMVEIKMKREESQPIREKTGGSTFANPSAEEIAKAGLPEGTKVWQLIDQVGGRGLRVGGAIMSEKHCNFMINEGTATAADLEALGEEIRKRVDEKFGIGLRWEIKRMGVLI